MTERDDLGLHHSLASKAGEKGPEQHYGVFSIDSCANRASDSPACSADPTYRSRDPAAMSASSSAVMTLVIEPTSKTVSSVSGRLSGIPVWRCAMIRLPLTSRTTATTPALSATFLTGSLTMSS